MPIVEVAETSYRIDREYKASLSTRGPPRWRYSSVDLLRPPANVTPLIAAAPIRVADLFP